MVPAVRRAVTVLAALAALAFSPAARAEIDPDSAWALVNKQTGGILAVEDARHGSGAALVLDKEASDAALWRILPLPDGGYRLVGKHSGRCATGAEPELPPVQWRCDNGRKQVFLFEEAPDQLWRLRMKARGLTLQAAGDPPRLVTGKPTGTDAELWALVKRGRADWKDVTEREKEREERKAKNERFHEALRERDYEKARALAAAEQKPEFREAHETVLVLAAGKYAEAMKAAERLAGGTSDELLLQFLAKFFTRTERVGVLASDAPERDLNRLGMTFLQKALDQRFRARPYVQEVEFRPPVAGVFDVSEGPFEGRTFHGTLRDFHSYDMHGNGLQAETFGFPVRAAADGIVAKVEDRHPDNPPEVKLQRVPANIVVLHHADGTRSHYVHLQQGSAKVQVGEAVRRGQVIAAIGNSGFTGGPHLHFTVDRDDDIAVPVRFTGLYRLGLAGKYEPATELADSRGQYADAPLPVTGKRYRFHGGTVAIGSFGDWEERETGGKLKYAWREQRRENGLLYLFDASRKVTLRIPVDGGWAEYAVQKAPDVWRRWLKLVAE